MAVIAAGSVHGLVSLCGFPSMNPHAKKENGKKRSTLLIESLGLISAGIRGPSGGDGENFLNSFDEWSAGDMDDMNKICTERFFQPLGSNFLRKPGRLALK